MKRKKLIIMIIITTIFITIENLCYSVVVKTDIDIVKIKNINDGSNLYILYNIEKKYSSRVNLKYEIKNIDKDIKNIEEQLESQKFSKEFEKNNDNIMFNGIEYGKIRIKKDVTIAYLEDENILLATIENNNVNVIETKQINAHTYFNENVNGYAGNAVSLKAIEYNANEMQETDITEEIVNVQQKKSESAKARKEMKDKIVFYVAKIGIIILFIAGLIGIPILIGTLIDKNIKHHNKK